MRLQRRRENKGFIKALSTTAEFFRFYGVAILTLTQFYALAYNARFHINRCSDQVHFVYTCMFIPFRTQQHYVYIQSHSQPYRVNGQCGNETSTANITFRLAPRMLSTCLVIHQYHHNFICNVPSRHSSQGIDRCIGIASFLCFTEEGQALPKNSPSSVRLGTTLIQAQALNVHRTGWKGYYVWKWSPITVT